MVTETDVELPGGRTLHVYDTTGMDGRLAVLWHHGTPNLGPPPEPLFPAADRLGIRWVSYDRPGYGGSTSTRAGTWPRRPPTSPASPTPWRSAGSRSWVTPVGATTGRGALAARVWERCGCAGLARR